MADDRIKLGVLWKNISRTGNKPYLSGRVQHDSLEAAVNLLRSGGRFLVLSNNKRPDKKDPDCVLFVVPEQERSQSSAAGAVPPQQPPTASNANRGGYQARAPRNGGR